MKEPVKRFRLKAFPTSKLEDCLTILKEEQRLICEQIGKVYVTKRPKIEEALAKYAIQDPSTPMELNKGILFTGIQGTGKSILMEAFCKTLHKVQNWPVKEVDALELQRAYRRGGSDMTHMEDMISDSQMLYIDDISEEVDISNNYGTKVFIGYELLSIRHRKWFKKGFLTFATSNASTEDLGEKYGDRIESRIPEMFNVFALQGDDMRKPK
jgi:DNA replication protein DnaC